MDERLIPRLAEVPICIEVERILPRLRSRESGCSPVPPLVERVPDRLCKREVLPGNLLRELPDESLFLLVSA